jgi:aspartate aminotransferase
MTLASRMSRIAPSPTLRVTAEADRLRRQGVDVVDLGAGEPDFPTPEHVKAAAHAALDANFTKYTPSAGVKELRDAVGLRYRADYGVEFKADEVIITAGAKQALYNAAMSLFEAGDEVITHAPFWPTIPEQVKLVEATPVIVHTHWQDSFAVHAEQMIDAITPKTKAIILNTPNNPTGALIDESAVAAIAEEAAKRGIWIVVDLCYEHLIYEDVAHNLPKVLFERHRDRTVLACSASKAYAMTGWRAGWTIAPAALTKQFNTIQGQTTSNITSVTQKAMVAALTGSQEPVAKMRDEFRRRRDSFHGWLTANPGIQCVKPKGAFYLFPNVEGLFTDTVRSSLDFAQQLLEKEHVVVTPGEAFDAPGYLRISYATSMERLREGADRMLRFAESLQPAKASAR